MNEDVLRLLLAKINRFLELLVLSIAGGTSSTSIRSSSCDILLSAFRRNTFASSFFQRENRKLSGL